MRLGLVVWATLALCSYLAGPLWAAPAKIEKAAKPAAKAAAKPAAQEKKPEGAKRQETAKKAADADKAKPAAEKKPASSGEKPSAEADAKPATHKVQEGPFKIEVAVKGVFQAGSTREVVLRPQAWKMFEVVKAVEAGTTVEKGDLLVEFDARDIDEAISDLRIAERLAELSIQQAEANLKALEATTPLDLAAAEQAQRYAQEDLKRFVKIDRPMTEKSANNMLRSAEDSLRYEKEELAQLEKMYKADDLTEQTEEIVLTRQRDAVRRAEHYVQIAKTLRDQVLEVSLPREAVSTTQATARQESASSRAKIAIPLALAQQRLELAKHRQDRAKAQEKLKKLEADRGLMKLCAPAGGVVYYGQAVRGKWPGAEMAAKNLRRGANVPLNDVLMTIVQARPMSARVSVPEKYAARIRPGVEGTIEPVAYPGVRLPVEVSRIDRIPSGDDFDAQLSVELTPEVKLLMPGMGGDVKLVPYRRQCVVSVPASAVFTDEDDEAVRYVYRVGKDGKSAKRKVRVGARSDDRIEILKGLKPGDSILKERPKDPK